MTTYNKERGCCPNCNAKTRWDSSCLCPCHLDQQDKGNLWCDGGKECRCICHQKNYPLPVDFPTPESEKEESHEHEMGIVKDSKVGARVYCKKCGREAQPLEEEWETTPRWIIEAKYHAVLQLVLASNAWESKYPTLEKVIDGLLSSQREELVGKLAGWIDGNIGSSSTAIYLYMAIGEVPQPFDAPSDGGDRGRCVALLKAVPEWVPRLTEIQELNIAGTRNGKKVYPWNEQIPLILSLLRGEEGKVE